MILVTGGCGFIGSNIVRALNRQGIEEIIVSDRLDHTEKWRNIAGAKIADYVDKDNLLPLISGLNFETVIHMGANTDTMYSDARRIIEDNFQYSKMLWQYCVNRRIRFIYASSAAVYGNGAAGFNENAPLEQIKPLNPYAWSKLLFDRWVTRQKKFPHYWAGLRFFNVYGPGESHKGRMASMVLQAYHQIKTEGSVRLFKSALQSYRHGEQQRDFIYVRDVADTVLFFHHNPSFPSGIYNVGTGMARTFNDLAAAVFAALGKPVQIDYIEMPDTLARSYQYHTKADLSKLRQIGYRLHFTDLEQGIRKYVHHLESDLG